MGSAPSLLGLPVENVFHALGRIDAMKPSPLKLPRLCLGLTLHQVGSSVGISPSRLSLAERGEISLRREDQDRLLRFYQEQSAPGPRPEAA
jgi:hypothetical protein